MYNSKFKLVLGWSLFIIVFYIFWLLAYFVLAKFALSEISNFRYGNMGLSEALSLGNIFWYLIYIGGIALCMYVIRLFIVKSPAPKSAALIYAVLIVISEAVLVKGLADSSPMINIFPHIAINTCFLFGIIFTYFKQGAVGLKTQAD
ncbi:hypothetical protein [Pedobacter africanus]|uniref:Uncharacterized protein n=1 Tax=Pedobacter africanus TaxID=151894 RepID=A0A1W2AFW1_9SPHI|nr:hypothetical protein [Pedobacter africanus]SMC59470.1 hypothetical protein SAMN04488524_1376 [Pedobacter africanus]